MAQIRKKNVFVWTNYKLWRRAVLNLLNDLVDNDVLKEIKRNPPRHFVSDNLAWFDERVKRIKGPFVPEVVETLVTRFCDHYQFIRGYHGCRPLSIDDYKCNGLVPCDPDSLDRLALGIFKNKEQIATAIKELDKANGDTSYRDYNRGKIWFCLESEQLTELCGHYLLYGSEYLQGIAARLGESDILRNRGRATLIECDIPIQHIPTEYITELMGDILKTIAEKYCVRPYENEIAEFGFHIEQPLEPRHIIDFHFPTGIPNPQRYQIREN